MDADVARASILPPQGRWLRDFLAAVGGAAFGGSHPPSLILVLEEAELLRCRYTPSTTFETYSFPWPPGREPAGDPRAGGIAQAAQELVTKRDAWLVIRALARRPSHPADRDVACPDPAAD
jgi:hypothetical protein